MKEDKIGSAGRQFDSDDHKKWVKLYGEGVEIFAIAERFGTTSGAVVYGIKKAQGVIKPRKKENTDKSASQLAKKEKI